MDFRRLKGMGAQTGMRVVMRGMSPESNALNERIRAAIAGGTGAVTHLTDPDGKQQFVFGFTPMDANHRVGHS